MQCNPWMKIPMENILLVWTRFSPPLIHPLTFTGLRFYPDWSLLPHVHTPKLNLSENLPPLGADHDREVFILTDMACTIHPKGRKKLHICWENDSSYAKGLYGAGVLADVSSEDSGNMMTETNNNQTSNKRKNTQGSANTPQYCLTKSNCHPPDNIWTTNYWLSSFQQGFHMDIRL